MYTNVTWPLWLLVIAAVLSLCAGVVLGAGGRQVNRDDVRWWKRQYLLSNSENCDLRRQRDWLKRRLAYTGIVPPHGHWPAPNGWPDPDPHDLITSDNPPAPTAGAIPEPEPAPPVPAWTTEHQDEDLELVGGVVQWNPGLAETGEMVVGDFLGGAA